MATAPSTIDHLTDLLSGAGRIRALPMFGEFGLYVDVTLIGLVCRDQLFLKITDATRDAGLEQGEPYTGARPHFVITEDLLDEPDRLLPIVIATHDALPVPKKIPKRLQTS